MRLSRFWNAVTNRFTPLATGWLTMANVTVLAPAGTNTVGGTPATVGALAASFTSTPPAGAGPDRVIVPTADWPPRTVDGLIDKRVKRGAVTAKVARALPPPSATRAITA